MAPRVMHRREESQMEDRAFDVGHCGGADSQVMTMPRSTEEILGQADELARTFEDYDPEPGDRGRVPPEFRLRIAALKRAEPEAEVASAVADARRKQSNRRTRAG